MFSRIKKKIKLWSFNRKNKCSINSLEVSLRSELGTRIRVGVGSGRVTQTEPEHVLVWTG